VIIGSIKKIGNTIGCGNNAEQAAHELTFSTQ
jgi:hypothetical protein